MYVQVNFGCTAVYDICCNLQKSCNPRPGRLDLQRDERYFLRQIVQGFTVNGQISTADEEESFVDKCIFVEGNANETDIVTYEGEDVETILIGFRMEEMHVLNCGYVTVAVVAVKVTDAAGTGCDK